MDKLHGVKFKNYKSFEQGSIDLSKNLIVIIGRNNAGKSSAIDVLQMVYDKHCYFDHRFQIGEIDVEVIPETSDISPHFRRDTISGLSSVNDFEYGKQFIGKPVEGKIKALEKDIFNGTLSRTLIFHEGDKIGDKRLTKMWDGVVNSCFQSIDNTVFRRLDAERDITPEQEKEDMNVNETGNGATNLIGHFLNDSDKDESIIEKKLLESLNDIIYPDAKFQEIRIQRVIKNGQWEIYLKEKDQEKRFALSTSGSGLKTLILILINLYVIPTQKDYKKKEFVFAFEEIENNLHPALQKRVFEFLYKYAVDHNIRIFLTTHSEAAINIFYGKEQANIYHVLKNQKGVSRLEKIDSYRNGADVLDDLGIKASDILQANGIIWVEGPSDRVYILKWLEEFNDFKYIEGRDFQFLYYGGRLMAHLAGNADEADDNLIHILKVNRNSALVMDSDRRKERAKLNETKLRVRKELEDSGMFCWVTKGKEIENYVSAAAVNAAYGTHKEQIGQYSLFPEYIESEDKNFLNHKVESARKFAQHITLNNSEDILDLREMIEKLFREIQKWNS